MTARREMKRAALSVGTVLVGKYRLERILGEGGMGMVYAAHHLLLDRPVALKLLAPEAVTNPEAVARFLNEARNAARIDNDYVCRVMDLGVLPEGQPYIAMELLEGIDLGRLLAARGRLPPFEAVGYMIQALTGIGGAHLMGVIHRDLKPSNLFLAGKADGSRVVKVLDFGISKATNNLSAPVGRAMTAVNNALGSPAYMSPEQVRNAGSIDPRADLWAVGVILYELCSGTRPFEAGSVAEVLAFILERDPEPLSTRYPGIPPGLSAIVARCLHKNVDERTGSAAELALALAPYGPWANAGARISLLPEYPRESVPGIAPRVTMGGAPPYPPAAHGAPEPIARTPDAWTQKHHEGPRARASSSPYLSMVLLGAAIGVALLAIAGAIIAVRGGPPEALASGTASAASAHAAPAVSVAAAPAESADAATVEPPPAEPTASVAAMPFASASASPAAKPAYDGSSAPRSPAAPRRPALSRQRR